MWQRQAIRHGRSLVKHIVPAIVKPLHSLWNEVIGFLFLSFATVFGFKTYSYFRSYTAGTGGDNSSLGRVVVTGFFAVMMAWFGISSFLRARKISRS